MHTVNVDVNFLAFLLKLGGDNHEEIIQEFIIDHNPDLDPTEIKLKLGLINEDEMEDTISYPDGDSWDNVVKDMPR
jgi:hypothetical protein